MENKYHYDLTNVHYAPFTIGENGEAIFSTPIRYPGAMSIEITPEGEISKTRADAMDYIVVNSNNGYTGKMTVVQVPEKFKVDCLGETVDEINSIQYEDASADPKQFALLFEFLGDKKNKRHVFYNVVCKRPTLKGENKENQKEPDTEEMEMTCSPLTMDIGGQTKLVVKSGTIAETKEEVYAKWYEQVMLPEKALKTEVQQASSLSTEEQKPIEQKTTKGVSA